MATAIARSTLHTALRGGARANSVPKRKFSSSDVHDDASFAFSRVLLIMPPSLPGCVNLSMMEMETGSSSIVGSLMEMGSGDFGCQHYRKCKIRAPCCDEIFDCRHCHNESKNSLAVDPDYRHDVPRHDLKRVICSLCNTEQDVQQKCIECRVCMGKYFCDHCKFFDDDVSKNQYHCDKCGICRNNPNVKENFFHCDKCGCCYSNILEDSHICVEKAMHHDCAICFEYLFDTTKDITVMPCGHTIHFQCLKYME